MFNEFKGTPGPWLVREIEGAFHNQKAYAIDFNEDQEQIVDYVYRKEDADLIAASPKLLKAVNDFLNHFEGDIPLWLFEEAEIAVSEALGK